MLTRLKAQPAVYPSIDLSYSSSEPVLQPVVLTLLSNGIRLRFDGPDQRLRLIEVLDFTKSTFSYKNTDVVRHFKTPIDGSKEQEAPQTGPSFRHIYNRLFGPSYPGEYIPPSSNDKSGLGTYVLSYPGVAFSFPLQHSKWTNDADFVSILSSSAALPARSMAIFNGSSWPDVRDDLFIKPPPFPRSISLTGRSKDLVADEVEQVIVHGGGSIEIIRRSSPVFIIQLSKTTPQDLVAELGPPDAIYRKYDSKIAIHGEQRGSQSTFRLVNGTDPGDALDSGGLGASRDLPGSNMPTECFYNYFHHGFDILVAPPTDQSPELPGLEGRSSTRGAASADELTVTKVLLHGNVPGSYPFNRHRRSRWLVEISGANHAELTSEMYFPEISDELKAVWSGTYASPEEERSLQRGMVLNRGWGESPDSSLELLGGWEDSPATGGTGLNNIVADGVSGLGNTELFGFPGMLFEVLKNGTVSCLTVY